MERCLVIYNKPNDEALADELDVIDQVKFVYAGLVELGYEVDVYGIGNNYQTEIYSASLNGYKFVFNLVESVFGYPEILYFIPALLNLHKMPYTGCPVEAAFSTASKVYAKKLMALSGIPVADNFKISEWRRLSLNKRYIVKPIWEDGSVGITEDSVFSFNGDKPEILEEKDDNHWFIESYLDGREFNVSIIAGEKGPLVLHPAEMVFNDYPPNIPQIVSYKAKWEKDTFQYINSVRSFDTTYSIDLLNEIESVAVSCWNLFNLHGYARVDMRSNSEGKVFVMEINANPCISGDSGFVAACNKGGLTEKEIIYRIINDINR